MKDKSNNTFMSIDELMKIGTKNTLYSVEERRRTVNASTATKEIFKEDK